MTCRHDNATQFQYSLGGYGVMLRRVSIMFDAITAALHTFYEKEIYETTELLNEMKESEWWQAMYQVFQVHSILFINFSKRLTTEKKTSVLSFYSNLSSGACFSALVSVAYFPVFSLLVHFPLNCGYKWLRYNSVKVYLQDHLIIYLFWCTVWLSPWRMDPTSL